MQKGDISNEVAPRVIFVFEHNIGYLRPSAEVMERTLIKARRWRRAVDLWEIPQHVHTMLWDTAWRWECRFDIVTYKPEKFAGYLLDRLNEEDVPFSNLWAEPKEEFLHRLTFMPSVQYVFHADPADRFSYGSRGVLLAGGLEASGALF
jgi:hypothetical protein